MRTYAGVIMGPTSFEQADANSKFIVTRASGTRHFRACPGRGFPMSESRIVPMPVSMGS
jgi:hypothetical protein